MKNKKLIFLTSVLALSIFATAGLTFADSLDNEQSNLNQPVRYGWNNGGYACTLTENDLTTIKGKISNINTTNPPFSIDITTDDNKIVNVHLGRIVFMDNFKELNLAKDMEIEIKGFYRTFNINNQETTVFKPISIKAKNKEIKLRDENNRPVWAGRKGAGRGFKKVGK
ncbi:hypothetical protein Y919_03715 [Caloranaerobacter azorensis H53214]|uniref:DUF5666 domain-containing protein n=1 Tax=Caloranaerobacter azorensis H53214 TaxID=1156417 RepID=A0A096BJC4_9FIRM|nr:hypothetical protein [Caloranaerobacter azorensis]KGG80863.1 hypothetical protein Y919_03715 [Caloranaerobacter azorensis H53214]